MKKLLNCSYAVISICIFLLTGCTTKKDFPENSISYKDEITFNNIQTETQSTITKNSFRIYTDLTNSTNRFDEMIINNQIDKDYNFEFEQATTTQEFINIQNEYIDKWKEEMHKDINKMESILIETDLSDFKSTQNEWESQLLESTSLDRNIIENSQYEIMIGSSFKWMWLSNIREEYRERTIHIKYLLYLLQEKGNK